MTSHPDADLIERLARLLAASDGASPDAVVDDDARRKWNPHEAVSPSAETHPWKSFAKVPAWQLHSRDALRFLVIRDALDRAVAPHT